MKYKEHFNIIFPFNGSTYVGEVYVFHTSAFAYFSIFLEDKELLFFVDDELDQWMENNVGNSALANIIGDLIDRHYHPDYFQTDPPIDPDESSFFL